MSPIDRYLRELGLALRTRGRRRQRILAECRDHLTDVAMAHGEVEALRRFGSAAELAIALDTETAARRGSRSTVAATGGVLAVAGSTLALLNVSDAGAAVALWAVVFFGAAQASAVSTLLAVLQAAALRDTPTARAHDLRLLGRRNFCALVLALLTELSAGAAVPGHGSTAAILAGPAFAALALVLVTRAWLLARRLDQRRVGADRSPLVDLGTLLGRRFEPVGPISLLLTTAGVAAPLAFVWNGLDRGSIAGSVAAGGVELALVLVGFTALGGALGLRSARTTT